MQPLNHMGKACAESVKKVLLFWFSQFDTIIINKQA